MTTFLSLLALAGLLGDPCYRTRERATLELIYAHRVQDAAPFLRLARQYGDPEVLRRVARIEGSFPPWQGLIDLPYVLNQDDDLWASMAESYSQDNMRSYCRLLKARGWSNRAITERLAHLRLEIAMRQYELDNLYDRERLR